MASASKPTPAELVALRDSAPTSEELRKAVAQDHEALLALAEARILALALTLPTDTNAKQEWPLPDAVELVAYLQNSLSDEARPKLEKELRGNPRALDFLIALRNALIGKIEDGAAAKVRVPSGTPRISLGSIQYKAEDTRFLFRRNRPFEEPLASIGEEVTFHAEAIPRLSSERGFDFEPNRLRSTSRRIARLRDAVIRLADAVDAVRVLRLQIEKGAGVGPERARDLPAIANLDKRIVQIESQISILQDELLMSREPPAYRDLSRSRRDVRLEDFDLEFRGAPSRPAQDWRTVLNLSERDIRIDLSGVAKPMRALDFSIARNGRGPVSGAEVTLVRPGRDFSTTSTDAQGMCRIEMPRGSLIALVDAESSYEFRLTSYNR